MTDIHSDEVLEKARELLCEMAELADGDPSSLSHSSYVMNMWNAFNRGRKYEKFVSMADSKDIKLDINLKVEVVNG